MSIKINVIDVGCGNRLIKPWKKNISSIGFYLGSDPVGTVDHLQEIPNKHICKEAFFNTNGYKKFYVCKKLNTSSFFKPDYKELKEYHSSPRRRKRFIITEKKNIRCCRLDDIISKVGVNFDFLKLDTQGSEYQILKGMGKYLRQDIIAVQAEVWFRHLYKGIKLFPEVDKLLIKNGFTRVKKYIFECKFWGDVLYLREDSRKNDKMSFIKKIYKVKESVKKKD